jgi:ribonucleoside-diphosphate reductase beta chain
MKAKQVFNEHGQDSQEDRKIIGGNSTGIANLNSVKYKWANDLYRIMLNNFWIPEKVSLVEDRVSIKQLTPDELEAFKNTLSFLIALDSMQTANLPRLSSFITAPEVSAIYTIQEFQELVHSQSYQYILQELFPNMQREEIYNYWRTNPLLLERNKVIASKYEEFNNNPNEQTFKKAIAADFALEGVYFYSGFDYFYKLASRNKAVQVAKIIRYIENDEVTHVSFMNYQIKELFDVKNNLEDRNLIINTLKEAAEQEIEWCHSIYGDRILGISKESTEKYVKWLVNQRSKLVGCGVIYKGFDTNPYEYLNADRRENFFETTVTEYSQSASVEGWDDF